MVHADGGAVRNAFLMQFVADMNQLKVHAAELPELSALGAVFSGSLGLKIYASLEDLQKLPFGYVEYTYSMDSVRVNSLFAGWQSAVQQVLYQPKQG
jgi:glycerol kinase